MKEKVNKAKKVKEMDELQKGYCLRVRKNAKKSRFLIANSSFYQNKLSVTFESITFSALKIFILEPKRFDTITTVIEDLDDENVSVFSGYPSKSPSFK